MINYLKRWIGELLIDIGKRLVQSSREGYVRYAARGTASNRYNW